MGNERSVRVLVLPCCAILLTLAVFLSLPLRGARLSVVAQQETIGQSAEELSSHACIGEVTEKITSVVDTYIDKNDLTDHSSSPVLIVRRGTQCALILFDLPCSVLGSNIVAARLEVWVTWLSGPMDIEVYRVCRPWDSDTTWRRCIGDDDWHKWGCEGEGTDCNEDSVDRKAYPENVVSVTGLHKLDICIRELVDDWAHRPSHNCGIVLKGKLPESGKLNWCKIAATNHSEPSLRPKLVITYEPRPKLPATVNLEVAPRVITICTSARSTLTATVRSEFDEYDCRVDDGTLVTFETSLGNFEGSSITVVATTDGIATTTLAPGSKPGSACITATLGGASDHREVQIIPGDPHHFEFDSMISSQPADARFPVSFSAVDCERNIITTYDSTATLTDTTRTISPPNASVKSGRSSVGVVISEASKDVSITVEDLWISGTSNPFEIVPPYFIPLVVKYHRHEFLTNGFEEDELLWQEYANDGAKLICCDREKERRGDCCAWLGGGALDRHEISLLLPPPPSACPKDVILRFWYNFTSGNYTFTVGLDGPQTDQWCEPLQEQEEEGTWQPISIRFSITPSTLMDWSEGKLRLCFKMATGESTFADIRIDDASLTLAYSSTGSPP